MCIHCWWLNRGWGCPFLKILATTRGHQSEFSSWIGKTLFLLYHKNFYLLIIYIIFNIIPLFISLIYLLLDGYFVIGVSVYFWDCILIATFLSFPYSKLLHIPLPALFQIHDFLKQLLLHAHRDMHMHICIPKYNLLAPFKVAYMYGFRTDYWALDNQLTCFLGEDHLSLLPVFLSSLCGVETLWALLQPVRHVHWYCLCLARIWTNTSVRHFGYSSWYYWKTQPHHKVLNLSFSFLF